MSVLHALSYVAVLAAFAFITLSLASGLLYVSELIEEHSRLSKVVGQRGIYAIIALHIVLYFSESLPLPQTAFSVLCHVVYLQNFSATWPLISLSSLSFVGSCILVIADHFMWFFYFSRVTQDARHASHGTYRHSNQGARVPGFPDIATFFGICVWLAPLFLFLSLSANDNTLPTSTSPGRVSQPGSPTLRSVVPGNSRSSLFRSLFEALPRLRPRQKRKDASEGIIAPRSPLPIPRSMPASPTKRYLSRSTTPVSTPGGHECAPRVFENDSHLSANFTLGTPPKRQMPGPAQRPTGEGLGVALRRIASTNRVDQVDAFAN